MDSELMLDVGQANEFKLAMRRNGWTNADLKKFCEGDVMGRTLSVLRGQSDIVPLVSSATVGKLSEHLIDTDTPPFVPSGWEAEPNGHKKRGQFLWISFKVGLFLSVNQQGGKTSKGHKLREELINLPVLNANVLDYLLAHPELIPESWKGKSVFFWGTIYRGASGKLGVRYLFWHDDGRWLWNFHKLDNDWNGHSPAAVVSVPA